MIRALATLLGLLALAGALPPGAVASERELLQAINGERTAAGIAPVAATQDWNDACAAHATYMAAGRILSHAQDPAGTAASQAGAWAAGNAVLARSTRRFTANPWANAPFHQFQLLHPWLSRTGVGISGEYACVVTLAGRDAPNPPNGTIITVPAAGQSVRTGEVARESPLVPSQVVGLAAGARTGPHLYVYAVGPRRYERVQILSAALLRDDAAAVPLRWVDDTNARGGAAVPGGAIVIPTRELDPARRYALHVRLRAEAGDGQGTLLMSRTTTFSTTTGDQPVPTVGAGAGALPTARSVKPQRAWRTVGSRQPVRVALSWSRSGVRLRLQCVSKVRRCTGPVRVLVKRRGGKLQRLRFAGFRGPLRVNLAPGRGVVRRVKLSRPERRSARARGVAVRWRGLDPVRVSVRRD